MSQDYIAHINEQINKFNATINDYRTQIDNLLVSAKEVSINGIMEIMIKIDTAYLSLCQEFSVYDDNETTSQVVNAILSEISEALLEYKGNIMTALKQGDKS